MKSILLAIAFLALAFSCSTKTETTEPKDSVVTTVSVSLDPPPPIYSYNPADSGTFKGLINLWGSSDDPLPEWAVSFVSDDFVGRVMPKEVYQEDSTYVLFYIKFLPVGPGVDELHASSFTKSGELISRIALGESYPSSGPDGGGKDFSYTYDTDRNSVYVTNRSTDWDEEKQEEVTTEIWSVYYLDEVGQLVSGRKYPEVSERYLEASDLSRFSKEELKIMRNEIFAVYGYIFKTEPLKSHYNALPWYIAERENVDDMLSEIEKANVTLIKEVETGL